MGEEFEALLDSMNVNDEEKQDYAVVLVQFDDFFNVRRNIIFERAQFNCRSQQEGETADEFIMELYKLIEDCNYGGLQDEVIRDRLVVGIRYQMLLEKMQLDPDLNQKAKKMAGQQEAICDQSRKLKKEEGAIVDAVSSRGPFSFKQRPKRVPDKKRCICCGGGHLRQDKCPAKEVICHNCHKKGQYSQQCFHRKNPPKSDVADIREEDEDPDGIFLDMVSTGGQESNWKTQLTLQDINFKIDTGAEATVISENTFRSLKGVKLTKAKK